MNCALGDSFQVVSFLDTRLGDNWITSPFVIIHLFDQKEEKHSFDTRSIASASRYCVWGSISRALQRAKRVSQSVNPKGHYYGIRRRESVSKGGGRWNHGFVYVVLIIR